MAKRKCLIWVPHGYRVRSSYRSRVKKRVQMTEHSEANVADKLENELTEAVSNTHHQPLDEALLPFERSSNQLNDPRPVAQFSSQFNPYQVYLNDMMESLTGMPKESFVTEVSVVDTVSSSVSEESIASATAPLDNLSRLEQTAYHPSQISEHTLLAITSDAGNTGDDSQSIIEDANYDDISTLANNSFSHPQPEPHLRWLTGIKPCLRSTRSPK